MDEAILQSELACVSDATTRLISVTSSSLSHTDHHQQERMPLRYFGHLFPFFWYPLTFSHCSSVLLFFPSPFPFPSLFLSSSLNFLASEFPSHQQVPLFPSAASFTSQFMIKLGLTSHIIVRSLLVTVENCIC